MSSTRWALSVLLFVAMLFSLHLSLAQTTSGMIVGTLSDQSGGVLPRTEISLTNVDTKISTKTVTDDSGYYQFFNIAPAIYKITVQKTGFRQLVNGPFKLEVEGSLRIDLHLQVGAEAESVTVTTDSPLIQAENTSLGSVIDGRQTVELPLNGRNPMNLTALVPSVVAQGQSMGTPNSTNPFGWGNYQIGGGMANQSAAYVDGAPVNTAYINGVALVPTQDSLAEFKVDTNDLTADYGHLAGGAIQFSTKSGTKNLHGSLWEYLRNKVLDANSYFNNHNGIPRGSFTQNQFGFNVGGPVVIPGVYHGRDRTFFFFNWEGFYQRQGVTYTETVPTAAELAGDMTLLPKIPGSGGTPVVPIIYDPLTTCTNINGCAGDSTKGTNFGDRLPFPGNKIPVNRLNQAAVNYVNMFYPISKVGTNNNNNNFTVNTPTGGQNFQYVAKIDHRVSEKQQLSSRFTFWKNYNLPHDPYGTGICTDRCAENFKTYNWTLDDTYVFNPTTILDLRLSYLRFEYTRSPKNTSFTPSAIGQTLGNGSSLEYPGPTLVSISGFDNGGAFSGSGGESNIGDYSDNDRIAGNLVKIVGKHTFKFGGEYQRTTFNFYQDNNPDGGYGAGSTFTVNNANNGTLSTTGSGLATFLLGYTTGGSYQTVAPATSEELYPAVFATDDWRITNKLTAHLGLRWENNLPWTDRHNNISYFDAGQVNPILAAAGITSYQGSEEVVDSSTRSQRYAKNPYDKQFSPRVGLSYELSPSTVVSAGYGILWIPEDVGYGSSPNNDNINSFTTSTVSSLDGGNTPAPSNNFSAPLPGGIIQPPKRSTDPVHGFQYVLLGTGNLMVNIPNNPYAYAQQWNFSVQKQFGASLAANVAYAGSKGTHLVRYDRLLTALPQKYFNSDPANLAFLQTSVANPFYGLVNPNYGLGAPTIQNSTLVSPYPQYGTMRQASPNNADSDYHSLQAKLQKRFTGGASIVASYTYSKLISSVDTMTSWLESSTSNGWDMVDPYRMDLEKSISDNDVKHHLAVTYVYDIPVGRGRKYLADTNRVTDAVVGGWGLEGITNFQSGFPLSMTAPVNNNSVFPGYNYQRPNIVSGCDRTKKSGGPIETRLWFNTSCFVQPPQLAFGESRNDSRVRQPGIDNWDTAIFKNFSIDKDGKSSIQFRTEFLNVWNRTQFGPPSGGIGGSSAGTVNSQANLPRLVQFALRITY